MSFMDLFPDSVIDNSIEVYTAKISAGSKIIYWIIILSLIIGLGCLPLIYMDISVQARGLFQSDIEKQVINAPIHGRVSFSRIQKGFKVGYGDTLFVLNTDGLEAQGKVLESIISDNLSCIRDLRILTGFSGEDHEFPEQDLQTPEYMSEFNSFKRSLEICNHKYQNARTEFLRNELLFEQKVISAVDFESSQNWYSLEKESLKQAKAHQLTKWQNDLTQRKSEARRLQAEIKINAEELQSRVVTSPVGGSIIQSADIQPGSFLAAGQMIAEISPDSELVAIFHIPPADIGFINTGQEVRLQVDAYNYHQWGMLTGTITEISDDLIYDGTKAYFRIKCILDGNYLFLKNGVTSEIIKGMTFTARVMVTRRSVFDLLFDKADKWLNPYNGNQTGTI